MTEVENNMSKVSEAKVKRGIRPVGTNKTLLGRISSFPQFGILVVFVLMIAVMSILSDSFFSYDNFINVLRQSSTEMVVAMGMTFVLILGGIDLSVGSIACLSGTIAAGVVQRNGFNTFESLVIGVLVGALAGFINGFISSKFKIPPFIASLAMMSMARGAALIYSGGVPIAGLTPGFINLGRGHLVGIPVPVVVMVIVVAICWVVLSTTKFGRYVYAIGGNEEVARLSGIRVNLVKVLVYVICGSAAAITGILYTARLASSQPTLGQGMELDAIASVVLGGTSLFGGRGYVFGTIVGGLFLAVLGNGLNMLGVTSFWQMVVRGAILLIAVFLYEKGQ